MHRSILEVVLFASLFLLLPTNALAADWYVDRTQEDSGDGSPEDPFRTIAEGIAAASDGDTVWVVGDPTHAYDDPGDRDLPVSGNILIKSTNGPENCIIDCQGGPSSGNWHRAFNITAVPGKHVEIEGLTIINGCHTTGAAIYAEMFVVGSPAIYYTIRNCRFENNDAYTGFGVIANYNVGGAAYVRCDFGRVGVSGNDGFHGNFGTFLFSAGNVIENTEIHGEFHVVNCSFIDNRGFNEGGPSAISAYRFSHFHITNCRFCGNRSFNEGVMLATNDSSLAATNCTFSDNYTTHSCSVAEVGAECSGLFYNCILSDNVAWGGNSAQVRIMGYTNTECVIRNCAFSGSAAPYVIVGDANLVWQDNITAVPGYAARGYWSGDGAYDEPDDLEWVWTDGDYRLIIDENSRDIIDAGNNLWLPNDEADVDNDGITLEVIEYDLDFPHIRVQYCQVDIGAYEADSFCHGDLDLNGHTDLSDLAQLLGSYGHTQASYFDGDLDCDGDVDLSDLAAMLGNYGCSSDLLAMKTLGGGLETESDAVTLEVAAVDTNGYTGGGFVGEVDHFVFDVKITVTNPFNDDWLVGGAALTSSNDAEFRLSTQPTAPDAYATFAAAPWTSVPGSSTANLAGSYQPASSDYVFKTGEINLGWYDTDTASHDGPATILRVVIDVSAVDGADVSTGFGSVYYSGKGPKSAGDIPVAELLAGAATVESLPDLATRIGCFYVKGQ